MKDILTFSPSPQNNDYPRKENVFHLNKLSIVMAYCPLPAFPIICHSGKGIIRADVGEQGQCSRPWLLRVLRLLVGSV